MHIGNIRLPNVFEKGPVTVKMPSYALLIDWQAMICFPTVVLGNMFARGWSAKSLFQHLKSSSFQTRLTNATFHTYQSSEQCLVYYSCLGLREHSDNKNIYYKQDFFFPRLNTLSDWGMGNKPNTVGMNWKAWEVAKESDTWENPSNLERSEDRLGYGL